MVDDVKKKKSSTADDEKCLERSLLPWCIVSSAGGNCITMFIHSQRLKKNIDAPGSAKQWECVAYIVYTRKNSVWISFPEVRLHLYNEEQRHIADLLYTTPFIIFAAVLKLRYAFAIWPTIVRSCTGWGVVVWIQKKKKNNSITREESSHHHHAAYMWRPTYCERYRETTIRWGEEAFDGRFTFFYSHSSSYYDVTKYL
jgi:hypothetical protein